MTAGRNLELAVLRASARGQLRLDCRRGRFLHHDRVVTAQAAAAIDEAIRLGHIVLSTNPAGGPQVRAELTLPRFGRIDQLTHNRAVERV